MFRQMLYTQWKWAAWLIAVSAVAAFAAPVIAVQRAGLVNPTVGDVVTMLDFQRSASPAYPILAIGIGAFLAVLTWTWDQRGKHVYALTLPIPRWYYALLRFGAGAVLLVPVMVALWIGALVAAAASTIPVGLHAYPTVIGMRFALALAMVYALVFAVASGTEKTLRVGVGIFAAVVVLQIVVALLGFEVNIIEQVLLPLSRWPGPFDILFGDWMLINV